MEWLLERLEIAIFENISIWIFITWNQSEDANDMSRSCVENNNQKLEFCCAQTSDNIWKRFLTLNVFKCFLKLPEWLMQSRIGNTCFYFSPLYILKCLLKLLANIDAKSHCLHLFDFSPLCVCISKCSPILMQSHNGCICLIFLQCALANVSSKCLPWLM